MAGQKTTYLDDHPVKPGVAHEIVQRVSSRGHERSQIDQLDHAAFQTVRAPRGNVTSLNGVGGDKSAKGVAQYNDVFALFQNGIEDRVGGVHVDVKTSQADTNTGQGYLRNIVYSIHKC